MSIAQERFARILARLALVAGAIAVLFAVASPPAHAVPSLTNLKDPRLTITRSTTQAGGHPDVGIHMQFCGPGVPIADASNTSPIIITTTAPHNLTQDPFAHFYIRGVQGNTAANGRWQISPVTDPNTGNADPTKFAIRSLSGAPSQGNGAYTGGGEVIGRAIDKAFGCDQQQQNAFLKDFTLHLPPGMLGNPTATVACPEHIWLAFSCPPESILGFSFANTIVSGGVTYTPANTPIYNVQTTGLEPAKLGTAAFPASPPGPYPVNVQVRSSGDRGLDSVIVNLPRNLGGPVGVVREIYNVLCGRVPCAATSSTTGDILDNSIAYDPATSRPFFVNPTSCTQKTFSYDARSWKTDAVTVRASDDVTSTGCQNVPFDLNFDVDNQTDTPDTPAFPAPSVPLEGATTEAGKPSAQLVELQYPREPKCAILEPTDPTCTYEDEDIWQAQLKDVHATLPEGLSLSAGGGVGLEGCTFGEFGVDETGKQVNDDPVRCPPGSEIGTLKVTSPAIPAPIGGKAYFGPTSATGRATPEHPWKLFLLLEGQGLRIKLVGDVTVSEDGQVSNTFLNQPELPFGRLELKLKGGDTAVLTNPTDCGIHNGSAVLTGWNGKDHPSTPSINVDGCPATRGFNPTVDNAEATPKQAGAYSVSHIEISRPDGDLNVKNIRLSLPAGAVGSLAAVPKCALDVARAGACPADTKVGTVKTTVGNGNGLLTASGSLFLGDAAQPGDAASIIIDVPGKAGPIDLGDVILISRVILRQSDTGVDVITEGVPKVFQGVPLPLRKIDITVDRPGFFINPTGCEPRPLIATFDAWEGGTSTSTVYLNAEGCENLPFNPKLRLISGAPGLTGKGSHPPLTAILTQQPGEANIKQARVVLPDILRPNVPQFNRPGGLCAEVDFIVRKCPALSQVGTARVITPVLPFELNGPVFLVQETVDPLPRLFVLLRGGGFEVPLKARNFFQGIRVVNLFETVPDVPQTYFELNIKGGPDGIFNAFFDMCKASPRPFDTQFTGQNGKVVTAKPVLEVNGCDDPLVGAASIRTKRIKIRGGKARIRVSCKRTVPCTGRLVLRSANKVRISKKAKGKALTLGSKRFSIPAKSTRTVTVRLSKKGRQVMKRHKRLPTKATVSVTGARPVVSAVLLRR